MGVVMFLDMVGYSIGRIEAVAWWSWLLKVRVVSGQTQSWWPVSKLNKGTNPSEVADIIMKELAEWARSQLKAERGKAKRK
jgi:hypothetical protein